MPDPTFQHFPWQQAGRDPLRQNRLPWGQANTRSLHNRRHHRQRGQRCHQHSLQHAFVAKQKICHGGRVMNRPPFHVGEAKMQLRSTSAQFLWRNTLEMTRALQGSHLNQTKQKLFSAKCGAFCALQGANWWNQRQIPPTFHIVLLDMQVK